jgi:flagellar motor switch protein FliM
VEQAAVLEEQGVAGAPSSETFGAERTEAIPLQAADNRFFDDAAEGQVRSALGRFAASLSVSLSATLGAAVTANLEALEQTTRGGFRPASSPGFAFDLSARPYHGNATLALSPGLVAILLEKLLGASGGAAPEIARELTSIESSILNLALETITKELRDAWSGFAPIDFRLAGDNDAGQAAAKGDEDEPVIAASVSFQVGDDKGLMGVAIPRLAVVTAQREGPVSGPSAAAAETEARQNVFEMLQNLSLKLEARLQGATVLASQLLRLKEGDVLGLGYPVERPVDCLVNGKCKYKARVMSSGSRITLRIDEPVVSPGP